MYVQSIALYALSAVLEIVMAHPSTRRQSEQVRPEPMATLRQTCGSGLPAFATPSGPSCGRILLSHAAAAAAAAATAASMAELQPDEAFDGANYSPKIRYQSVRVYFTFHINSFNYHCVIIF